MKLTKILPALVGLALVSCGSKSGMSFGDNEYPVATVESSSATLETSYPATIKGIQDVEIRPKVAGFITQVCVKEGQTVGAGQLLFVIDNETYKAAVRQCEAAVNTCTAQVNTAKMTFDNSQKLFESNVIGSYELQSAQNAYESAKAQLAQAEASLASAKETLSYCYVKSPSAGVVGNIPYKVGTMVSSSSTPALTTVSNISTMEVYFSMNEKDILALTRDAGGIGAAIESYPPVSLRLADGTTYEEPGKVTKVSGVIDSSTGSVQVIAQFPNPNRLLKSGGSGLIVVPKSDTQAIVIPQSVTIDVQNKMFVYTVGADNKVKYTEITVDPQNDGKNYIVRSGLKAGDKYVTNGITKLTDGAEIVPITPERYQQKINEATELSKGQGTMDGYKDAMSK